jgi:hypothetical protein
MAFGDYHVFAVPCAVKDAEIGIMFSELENELGGGFYSQLLYGSENGERFWRLTLPTLTDSGMDSRTVTGINGETLTYAEYIWDLFCTQKVDGTPFAYRCPRNGNYYLVRFANRELTYQRMLTKLYSTGIELKQWRIEGETVFAASTIGSAFDAESYPSFEGTWDAEEPPDSSVPFINSFGLIGGDVTDPTSGSRQILRFSATTNDGYISTGDAMSYEFFDVFLLMKMREATFSNTAGILTGDAAPNNAALVGASGTTKFFDFGFGAPYTYKLDGLAYAENDQQAPMNEWGIVHIRFANGITLDTPQIGKDRDFVGRFAELDLAYLILTDELLTTSTVREVMEYLSILKAQL